MKDTSWPDCLGRQAEALLDGETPAACLECDLFDKCHKITVAAWVQSISESLELMVENGLAQGWLKGFDELEKARNPKADRGGKK